MVVPGKYKKSEYSELLWSDDKINGIVDNLKSMGLTEYESRALCALFLKKEATAPEISDFAKIPNTKLYYVLEGLEKHGLIKSRDGRPKKFYVEDPEEVLDKIGEKYFEKVRMFEEMKKSTLEVVEEVFEHSVYYQELKSSVRVVTTYTELIHLVIYLKRKTSEWLCIFNSDVWRMIVNNPKHRHTMIEELKSGKKYFEITDTYIHEKIKGLSNLEEIRELMYSAPNVECRLILSELLKYNILIGDRCLVILLFDLGDIDNRAIGLLIQDRIFAESVTEYFYKIWDRAFRLEDYL